MTAVSKSKPHNHSVSRFQECPIAIVGMGGVFPGATDLGTFWENLQEAKSSAKEVPAHRWIMPPEKAYTEKLEDDHTYSKIACLIEDEVIVDTQNLNINSAFLRDLDPLYSLTLKAGQEAYLQAEIKEVAPERMGVVLAAIALPTDGSSALMRGTVGQAFAKSLDPKLSFVTSSESSPPNASQSWNGRVTAFPAQLLAHALGLEGVTFTLDAACASSLYAIKLACDELQEGRADAMLAGGVSRPENLYTQVGFSQLRALSSSGQCSPFDKDADGLVVGEGAGIFVLKRLDDAVQSGDQILGVIRGIGLSNDIGGNLLAPDSEGQVRAMQEAYLQSGWEPSTVDMIECHGTGTPLGDKTELASLKSLWDGSEFHNHQCAIGSVKSMIGHLLTGAAAASLTKILLALKNQTILPSANLKEPLAAMSESPFFVPTEAKPWPKRDKHHRRAAVSAFGFGGINAHLLVEEWNDESTSDASHHLAVKEDLSQGWVEREPVAIVGMDAHIGADSSLQEWKHSLFQAESRSANGSDRWGGVLHDWVQQNSPELLASGNYLSKLSLPLGKFRLPPNEMSQILPQQLLMLQVAAAAMEDAGFPLRERRPRMGTFIGVGFDFACTRFHLRWSLWRWAPQWAEQLGLRLTSEEMETWIQHLQDQLGPPLNATRTVGALGGIVASRLAKEFLLGGPSFILSNEDASGMQALELATRAIQRGELDAALVGAVDITGDSTYVSTTHQLRPYSASENGHSIQAGEGAVALVIKRYSDAVKDGDRIYSLVHGFGTATSSYPYTSESKALQQAKHKAYQETQLSSEATSYISFHSRPTSVEERLSLEAATTDEDKATVSLGVNSHTDLGATSGLASTVKASLALHHKTLPANLLFDPKLSDAQQDSTNIPIKPQAWIRNQTEGPRQALVTSAGLGGSVSCCLLQEHQQEQPTAVDTALPLAETHSLFVLEGDSPTDLLQHVEELGKWLQTKDGSLSQLATLWFEKKRRYSEATYGIGLVSNSLHQALQQVEELRKTLSQGTIPKSQGVNGIYASPTPLSPEGKLAFVYPGSGNHYVGMGRELGVRFPQALTKMDDETERLKDQLLPNIFMPWRSDWPSNWRTEAAQKIASKAHHMIFGQVVHGGFVTEVCRLFNLKEDAIIGYSLGESAGLFASKVWPERGQMLTRMEESRLFVDQLAGPCTMARQVWNIPEEEEVGWRTAVVQKSVIDVKRELDPETTARLLIVNTPDECVIGGRQNDVEALVQRLGSEAFYLEGIVTVHCEAVEPVKDDYKAIHLFPTSPKDGVRYYSGYLGRSYEVTPDSAAESVMQQALHGFDYTQTIEQAYKDGVRLFVEMGPRNSCTRMIGKILGQRDHFAMSACVSGESDVLTIQKLMAGLIANRVPVDLTPLYPSIQPTQEEPSNKFNRLLTVDVKQEFAQPTLPEGHDAAHTPQPLLTLPTQPLYSGTTVMSDTKPPIASMHHFPSASSETKPVNGDSRTQENPSVGQPISSVPAVEWPTQPQSTTSHEAHQVAPHANHGAWSSPMGQLTSQVLPRMAETLEAKGQAHDTYLRLSQQNQQAMMQNLLFQQELLERALTSSATEEQHQPSAVQSFQQQAEPTPPVTMVNNGSSVHTYQAQEVPMEQPLSFHWKAPAPTQTSKTNGTHKAPAAQHHATSSISSTQEPELAFDREQCMEFAIGQLANVFGPDFAVIDSYDVRVRLPDEPLMLVDRILTIEGTKGTLGSGNLVTEHDVHPGAWYLDAERMPVCVTVEAGQADLFLCSYLGIDFKLKGKRAYRLLDAEVSFHRELPKPGEVIQYDITIDKFVRQGDVYLFFFRFDGTIDGKPLLTMRNGCAGFFTDEEIHTSSGVVRTPEEWEPKEGKVASTYKSLLPFDSPESYDEEQVKALRKGNYAACFGDAFAGLKLHNPTYLPSGKMKLFDRVKTVDPQGGRYGLGLVRAEADIHPDDWFLTCHFMDDMVMPGTLMYECCAHTLRVLLMRMGWVGEHDTTHFEPVIGRTAKLSCRGPVTPESKLVVYEVEIKEIGVEPYPYVIADALMYVDGKCSVSFDNMSMQMTGQSYQALQDLWQHQLNLPRSPVSGKPVLYNPEQILAYAIGKPSEGFGELYKVFDEDRIIARLPGPPYMFLDRVVEIEPKPWVLKAGGWIETEYDIPEDAWYFDANHQPTMPFAVLLEVALQPCGWLAAYLGSALQSETDLSFRNLGGKGKLTALTLPTSGTLTVRVQMYEVSKAGGMIIERFNLEVHQQGELIYEGTTYFGFFTKAALSEQIGIRDAKERLFEPLEEDKAKHKPIELEVLEPIHPVDTKLGEYSNASMPGRSLQMIDRIDMYLPEGGPHSLGFIRGSKDVDPTEWFFKAHFYQDPVCPGSLGLESFLQLLRYIMLERWGESHGKTHRFEPILLNDEHSWVYRGQIVPKNKRVEVDAMITDIQDGENPEIRANGFLKVDGAPMYEMIDFGLRMIPIETESV